MTNYHSQILFLLPKSVFPIYQFSTNALSFAGLKTLNSSLTMSPLLPWHLICPLHLYMLASNISNKYSLFQFTFFVPQLWQWVSGWFSYLWCSLQHIFFFFLQEPLLSSSLIHLYKVENLVGIIPLMKVNSYYSLAQNSHFNKDPSSNLPSNPMYQFLPTCCFLFT